MQNLISKTLSEPLKKQFPVLPYSEQGQLYRRLLKQSTLTPKKAAYSKSP